MKKLSLLMSLVLTTSIIFGQDMLLKKQTVVLENGFEIYAHYKYDADWKLDSIIQVSQSGDTGIVQLFEDERLVFDDRGNNTYSYTYFEDSANSFSHWNENTTVFLFNEGYEVYLQKNYGSMGENWGNITYAWENRNCVLANYSTGQTETITYDEDYLNPFENENKFLKRSFQGSKNFMSHGEFISFTYDQTVQNSLNAYPTEVDFTDGNENRTIYFDYYNFTGIENELIDKDVRVIDIRYFNLLGQQIEIPTKGFYLECKITDKGVISKKFLIP